MLEPYFRTPKLWNRITSIYSSFDSSQEDVNLESHRLKFHLKFLFYYELTVPGKFHMLGGFAPSISPQAALSHRNNLHKKQRGSSGPVLNLLFSIIEALK
jgi:hypothetical protein